jgi:hypothetical protein
MMQLYEIDQQVKLWKKRLGKISPQYLFAARYVWVEYDGDNLSFDMYLMCFPATSSFV